MPEELNPDSLSDAQLREPGIVEAAGRVDELVDRDVFDVNGDRLGSITKCFAEGGRLVSCDVRVDGSLKRALNVDADVAKIRPEWITDVTDDGVRLMKAAGQVLPGAHDSFRESEPTGSDTFPRKTR